MRGKKRPQSERIRAVALAEVAGMTAASEATGIPITTIDTWMDRPEFVELRNKTREDLADGFKVLTHLATQRLIEALQAGAVEPRDLTILLGVATDKTLLMSGEATSRAEVRSLTDGLDDHERELLGDAIRGELARRADARAADGAVGTAGAPGTENPAR